MENQIIRPTIEELQTRFTDAFADSEIQVIDESHLHLGHKGAEGGAGHYKVIISSARFAGLNRVARHRLVYDAVADWMPERVHALTIDARDA